MNNKLFEEKAKEYRLKPKPNIKACKYEEGMENGWVVGYYNEYYENYEIFDTKDEAFFLYNTKPQQLIKGFKDNYYEEKYVETYYYEPFPCLWDYNRETMSHERIYENDWIIDNGNSNYETASEEFILNKYELI